TDRRSTPGMDGTASRRFSPSTTKTGQMKSDAESLFSATSFRVQSCRRKRRMRRAGNLASVMAMSCQARGAGARRPPARGCCAGGKGGPISAGHSGAAMDFDLTEDERAVEDTARRFAKDRLAPFAAEWDAREFFPVETLREAAALGFAGIYVKSDVGGSEMSRLDAAIIMEELSAGCTSTAAFISIHNMASWMIDRFGSDEQRRRFLPKMTTMDKIASYCLTEPGSGSDAASLKTRAVRDGDHYVVSGGKAFISGAGVSDVYVCMV